MLVEINLLPKKEHRQSSRYIIALFVLFLFAASISMIMFYGGYYEEKMELVDKQTKALQKQNIAQQERIADGEAGNSAVKLQSAVKWAQSYPVETVPLLRNIILLLPERGFIKSFVYTGPDSVNLQIQFDASRDAAYYLSLLKQSEWVEDVDLKLISAIKPEGDQPEDRNTDDSMILPRYIAEFEIFFNPEFFKEIDEIGTEEDGG